MQAVPRRRFSWGALALEVVSIVLAVLLALAVNQWRENRANERLAQSVLQTIRGEVERNQRLLDRRLPYHQAIYDSLETLQRFFVQDEQRFGLRPGTRLLSLHEMGFNNGLSLSPTLSSTGWETALATQVMPHLDYPTLYALSELYTKQEELRQTEQALLQAYNGYITAVFEAERPVSSLFQFSGIFTDLLLREKELLEQYEKLSFDGGDDQP